MRRTQLIKTVIDHEPRTLSEDCQTSVDWWEQNWAKNVFSDEELRKRVPHSIYKNYKQSLKSHSPLSTETANAVANAMKDWAIAKGATHFTHWFQPLHVSTAEKHESFIAFTGGDKTILVR
jgi:glutamine synthetase